MLRPLLGPHSSSSGCLKQFCMFGSSSSEHLLFGGRRWQIWWGYGSCACGACAAAPPLRPRPFRQRHPHN
eukprot:15474296-Alexandrium_andersonii.AAC.1